MLEIKHLNLAYQKDQPVLSDLSFKSKDGSLTGIIGPNGAGKSSLFKAILQFLPYSGAIYLDGKPVEQQLTRLAYVEQRSLIDFNFPITVRECISLGRYPHKGLFQRLKTSDWSKVDQAMELLEIDSIANHSLGQLSGGQFQRVLMARCLVQEASYLFLDEPFIGIDQNSELKIINLLKDLASTGKTIFVIHHNLANAPTYFDQLLLLNHRLIAYGDSQQVLREENLNPAYGFSSYGEVKP